MWRKKQTNKQIKILTFSNNLKFSYKQWKILDYVTKLSSFQMTVLHLVYFLNYLNNQNNIDRVSFCIYIWLFNLIPPESTFWGMYQLDEGREALSLGQAFLMPFVINSELPDS